MRIAVKTRAQDILCNIIRRNSVSELNARKGYKNSCTRIPSIRPCVLFYSYICILVSLLTNRISITDSIRSFANNACRICGADG